MTTFMGVRPTSPDEPGGVTVLGAPVYPGAGGDPGGGLTAAAAIRAASARILPARIDSDLDPLHELDVRDGGDVTVPSGSGSDGIVAAATDISSTVLADGAVPLLIGGDGSVGLSMLRATAREIGTVAVVHLDAHTDCNPPGRGINTGSAAFWTAHAEGLVELAMKSTLESCPSALAPRGPPR